MDVGTDWSVAAVFTQYDTWFDSAYNSFMGLDYSRLFMDHELGNNEGDRIDLNWLGAAPQMREWIDEKRPRAFNKHNHVVIAADFEATLEVDRNAISDGKWRQYERGIREMGNNARRHPWKLITQLILDNGVCYDGQAFFSATHSEGNSGVQSNLVTGTGTSYDQISNDYFAVRG